MALLVSLPTVLSINIGNAAAADQCNLSQYKKELVYTKEQKEKLHQAEKAADHFVKRWRETLDMNILFEELYVTDPDRRQRNALLFCGECLEETGKVDNDTLKRGFLGFWNLNYLQWEYSLTIEESEDDDRDTTPPGVEEIEKEMDKIKENYGESGPQRGQIRQQIIDFISVFEKASNLYRRHLRHLPSKWFNSTRYKQNYQREYAKDDKSKTLDGGLDNFPLKPGEVIYQVKRGVFDLFFVEEAGKFKVLTIGYEL